MNKDIAVADYDLGRVIDFNFFPILEMDESWWQPEWLPHPIFNRLVKNDAARHKLCDFILEKYQLKHENYFDFSSYEKQVALLGRVELKALLYAIGLITEADTIAHAIEREAQQAIKQSLGSADYLYALKNRTSIHHSQSGDETTHTDKKTRDYTNFKARVHQSGLRCLLTLLNDMPQGFIQRILFKLPKAWSALSWSDDKADYGEIRTCLPRLFKELKTA